MWNTFRLTMLGINFTAINHRPVLGDDGVIIIHYYRLIIEELFVRKHNDNLQGIHDFDRVS